MSLDSDAAGRNFRLLNASGLDGIEFRRRWGRESLEGASAAEPIRRRKAPPPVRGLPVSTA